MRSIVWSGDRIPTQGFGRTDVLEEPWWPAAQCHWHCGIDIPMNAGEELHAARAGRVLYVGIGFLTIAVGGEADWYLHGSSYVVRSGQSVDRGQLVGYAGDVAPPGGVSFGSHLHFERQSTLNAYCNIPVTSLDPVPILTAGDSPIQGGDDMSLLRYMNSANAADPLNQTIYRIGDYKAPIDGALFAAYGRIGQGMFTDVEPSVLAKIPDLPGSSPAQPIDLTAIKAELDAILASGNGTKAELDSLQATAAHIAAKIDKDLA